MSPAPARAKTLSVGLYCDISNLDEVVVVRLSVPWPFLNVVVELNLMLTVNATAGWYTPGLRQRMKFRAGQEDRHGSMTARVAPGQGTWDMSPPLTLPHCSFLAQQGTGPRHLMNAHSATGYVSARKACATTVSCAQDIFIHSRKGRGCPQYIYRDIDIDIDMYIYCVDKSDKKNTPHTRRPRLPKGAACAFSVDGDLKCW